MTGKSGEYDKLTPAADSQLAGLEAHRSGEEADRATSGLGWTIKVAAPADGGQR